jgi:F0F1-type ATP synthase membrane subunit c/vacuolar-type H+-ATPase subunit K
MATMSTERFPTPTDTDTQRRLNYAAAVACGVFAALVVHIALTVLGVGLDAVLRIGATGSKQQFVSAIAWWAIGGAGFIVGWATGAYLIAAAREREFVFRLARRFLIALVFAAATAGGILSKGGDVGGTVDVIAGVTALGLGVICAFCGARLAYLNAEQV